MLFVAVARLLRWKFNVTSIALHVDVVGVNDDASACCVNHPFPSIVFHINHVYYLTHAVHDTMKTIQYLILIITSI